MDLKSADFPDFVKVAGYQMPIEFVDTQECQGEDRVGVFIPLKQAIRIDSCIASQHLLEVFLHELMHAIFWAYNIQDEDREERLCGFLGGALLQVIADNPELWQVIGNIDRNIQT